MLVNWEWLAQYVRLDIDPDTMALRFAMSGLNHESTSRTGADVVIDLEVTSNRGDCLGHIGVAREASVLLESELLVPDPAPKSSKRSASELISVENRFLQACPRYTARVIRGVTIGPSPEWLSRRLQSVGIASINNVVDVTNYVMMECGQPLHAFDLHQVRGGQVVIRPAKEKEKFLAIDHRTYELDSRMVVIADRERAIALGGVMGGADSEVSSTTTDLLIEAASFEPLSIRRTARLLKLQSPSSHRFERRPDPSGLDWASRRCCELILQVAGGELLSDCVSSGNIVDSRQPITLRRPQIARILGIDIPANRTDQILHALGCQTMESSADRLIVLPPTWRADLSREIDLIEEVARIHGYDAIPEDVDVPLGVAVARPRDLMLDRVRHVLSAYGIDEAMTASVVSDSWERFGSVWTSQPPLATETPLLVGARHLRRTLLPSLLACRHANQAQTIRNAQLYEVANIYLAAPTAEELPSEESVLALITQGDLQFVKGIVEEIVAQVAGKQPKVRWLAESHPCFEEESLQRLVIDDILVGFVGLISESVQQSMSLDQSVAAAELRVDALARLLVPVRRAEPVSLFPAIARDLNFIVDEQIQWKEICDGCQQAGGQLLQDIRYRETYRDTSKDGLGKKRILMTLHFQSLERTLTSEEIDLLVASVIQACAEKFQAKLLG